MKNKRITFALIALYFLPWGIQYLINNFMSVYVASLPFATEKTVGEVIGLGAIITCISQTVWPYFAGKAKNKSNVLCLSLVLLAFISLLFLNGAMTKLVLFGCVVLFYSCFMVHQPLIDTICSEIHHKTGLGFGFFRSFASLGFGLFGVILMFLPHDDPKVFFVYIAILAAVSALVSKTVRAPRVENAPEEQNKNVFNAAYLKFLAYTFVLFIGCAGTTNFFSVYYTAKDGLSGNMGTLSLILGLDGIAEWLVIMAISKFAHKFKSKHIFTAIAFLGVFRSFIVYIAPGPGVAALSMLFSCSFYGLLWATLAPYIKKIVPAEGNAFAQGLWTVVASGAGTFVGSYLSGVFAEAFGMKLLFLALAILMAVLTAVTPALIED